MLNRDLSLVCCSGVTQKNTVLGNEVCFPSWHPRASCLARYGREPAASSSSETDESELSRPNSCAAERNAGVNGDCSRQIRYKLAVTNGGAGIRLSLMAHSV